jgi:hypothetical protein
MSSASGPSQFIDSTWLSTVRAHRPDLADQPDSALLALKTDPQLSRDMTAAYASDNQALLSKAGIPVTPGTTYLAHFAGPQGAIKVMQADPSAPVSEVLGPGVVKANPFLANMTAQGLQAWASRKMGAETPGVQASAPQTAPASPAALPAGQSPIFPATPPQQQQAAPDMLAPSFAQIPEPQAPPIFFAPRRPINLAALQAAIRAPILPRS